jgi:hypothetical protein
MNKTDSIHLTRVIPGIKSATPFIATKARDLQICRHYRIFMTFMESFFDKLRKMVAGQIEKVEVLMDGMLCT